jgi:N-succinyldiaminopimelate aminotransferase
VNSQLGQLHPYPFEKLNALMSGVQPPADLAPIALSLGEPKHRAADFLIDSYSDKDTIARGFGTYPPTKGLPELRQAIADFVNRRFELTRHLDPDTEVLPVNGTREALFAIAQTVIDSAANTITLMPNPFYQIYEGAAILAGSQPAYVPCTADNDFNPDFTVVTEQQWQACAMVYICTPGNPSGSVMTLEELQNLIRLSDEHDFVIVSDECYSEIYADQPPAGLLQAASAMGRHDYRNCVAFNSLSKRSNLPGLRSGYACGDAEIINRFLLYRTYHGSAMPVHNQWVSELAWRDEDHVVINRQRYREKFDAVLSILENVWPMQRPPAGFYLWPQTPIADDEFARRLLQETNIKVLPGSYLSREVDGVNPGYGRVRMALVAGVDECAEAANRIKQFLPNLR